MSWTHIEDTTPKAKRDHRCTLCGLPINAREKHVKRYGIMDGERVSPRLHLECDAYTKAKWSMDDWEVCVDESEFRRELEEWRTANAAQERKEG